MVADEQLFDALIEPIKQSMVSAQVGSRIHEVTVDVDDRVAKGEVLVRYVASGVCHSDLHHIQGKVPHPTPVVFGHEGGGIVEAVGPDVSLVQVGDHVLTSYIPSCGRCPWCVTGRPNMCDLRDKPRHLLHDGTSRFRKGNQEIYQYLQVSTYADRAVVPEVSLIPIRKDAPLDVICWSPLVRSAATPVELARPSPVAEASTSPVAASTIRRSTTTAALTREAPTFRFLTMLRALPPSACWVYAYPVMSPVIIAWAPIRRPCAVMTSDQPGHGEGRVDHAVGEAPFIVVPADDANQLSFEDGRFEAVDG